MRWRLLAVLSAFSLAAACGGRSIRHGEGGEAGDDFVEGTAAIGGTTGGRNGTGGTGMGALGGTGGTGMGALGGTGVGALGGSGGNPVPVPAPFCEWNGLVLSVGQSTENARFCETCTCQSDGSVDCTRCNVTCRVAATTVEVGRNVLMPDGCTNCVCTITGMDCDSNACATPDPCRDLITEYELAVGAGRWCGREYNGYTCTSALLTEESIPCGCDVLVRSLEPIWPIANAYIDMGCPPAPICEKMCEEPRPPYRCSEAGFCVGAI
jgi:hypothetical protein